MNKTAKPTSNTNSKWTQQDAANKTYPRLRRRHKKQKAVAPVACKLYDVPPHAVKVPRS